MGESQVPELSTIASPAVVQHAPGNCFCMQCSAENPPERAACVLCYCALRSTDQGQICPLCTTDNPRTARFCRGCGSALEPGLTRLPTMLEMAQTVLHGAASAPSDDEDYEQEYEDEYGEEYAEDDGFLAGAPVPEAVEEVAPAPAPAPAPVPAPVPAPEPESERVLTPEPEDELEMPPNALELQEAAYIPSPSVEEEVMLPPAPIEEVYTPPAPAPAETYAPAAELYEEAADDDFVAPPAVPTGMSSFVEDDLVGESLAGFSTPAAEAAVEEAPAPTPPASSTSGDDDFAEWSLEVPEGEK